MAEVTVEFIKGEKTLTWYSDVGYIIGHMRKLAEEHPDDVKVVNDDGESMIIHCPVRWFREPKPPIKREYTEEQRKAMSDRAKSLCNNDKTT